MEISNRVIRVATDVGGTFTDLVYCSIDPATGQTGEVVTTKTDTTPPDFETGMLAAITKAGLELGDIGSFAHGTTVVINALTERKGAKTGLITTAGFRDVLEIARGNRPDLFNFVFSKPAPFVPRHLRLEVSERLDKSGKMVRPFDAAELEPIIAHFKAEGVEAIAICFLHAYANPAHELEAADALRAMWPEAGSVLTSHSITREWREYERTSTTVLSAYVHPVAQRYLGNLGTRLRQAGLASPVYVMQSNGGVATLDAARQNPINMVKSGPASGMLGAIALGGMIGENNLIALDIGGTTAKCALIKDGRAQISTDYKLEWSRTNSGYPIKIPVLDLIEIGNGGGSIAWVDAGGKMHVGPQSAGALPGPASYGRGGTEPTTTDANLITGRINRKLFLEGQVTPDMDAVRQAFRPIAERFGISVEECARGVIRVANANMVNALKLVSLNKGFDPRAFTLIAFGGGGGMHAASLARELGIGKVIIPINASVFSAWGMLMTDLRRDTIRTRLVQLDSDQAELLTETFDELTAALMLEFAEDSIPAERVTYIRYADMRYRGQEHSVKVELPGGAIRPETIDDVIERFHKTHEREYSFRLPVTVELVNFHLAAISPVPKPDLPHIDGAGRTLEGALNARREVDFDEDGVCDTPIYSRDLLPVATILQGPAIIEEPTTTTIVLPGQTARMDEYGNIHIQNDNQRRSTS